jgi:hypothetical protein
MFKFSTSDWLGRFQPKLFQASWIGSSNHWLNLCCFPVIGPACPTKAFPSQLDTLVQSLVKHGGSSTAQTGVFDRLMLALSKQRRQQALEDATAVRNFSSKLIVDRFIAEITRSDQHSYLLGNGYILNTLS